MTDTKIISETVKKEKKNVQAWQEVMQIGGFYNNRMSVTLTSADGQQNNSSSTSNTISNSFLRQKPPKKTQYTENMGHFGIKNAVAP